MNLTHLPDAEKADLLALLDELESRKRVSICQNDFLAFIAALDATYKFGTHLKRLGALLTEVEQGYKDRIAVSMAPRMGKSQMISIYYPAWYLGKNPTHKVIVASHTAELAVDMARKVRNLMQTAEYRRIFPNTTIASDAKAAGKWNTSQGGEYFAIGTGGALAGRGADLIVADDPLSEQDIKAGNFDSLDALYEWFSAGLRTRLMPGGKICILHTRWHQRDLIGRLIKDSATNPDGDQYEIFEFPAILNEESTDPDNPPKSLWPEQWSLESLLRTKASMSHILWQWNAQYMQNPTASESAIIKREWIKWWPHEDPPKVDFIVQSYDTALTTKTRSDYSVCHTWGVFFNEEDNSTNVILLNKVKGKWEFPELKQMALEQYRDWEPDSVIVEAKASGQPLIDEMRRSGIFVQDYSPGKGQDKIARLNAVADMFASGHVWFPETHWAQATVEEIVSFPAAEHDDECFVADTKITMFDGRECDILSIREGDFVWTPTGPQRVLASGCSNRAAQIIEVSFTDGRSLRGTANHPVYVSAAQAFVPLGSLQHGDFVCTSKYFSTAELTTVDTLIARTPPCETIFMANVTAKMRRCIDGFGKTLTDLFQKVSISTTKTPIPATIGWKTLSALVPLSTVCAIAQTMKARGLFISGSGRKQTVNKSASNLRHTPVQSAMSRLPHFRLIAQNFVPLVAGSNTIAEDRPRSVVSFVPQLFRLLAEKLRALIFAKPSETDNAKSSATINGTYPGQSKLTCTPALNAVRRIQPAKLAASYVPLHAKKAEPYGCSVSAVRVLQRFEAVYALQVAGNPVFYANGILVHNCDAMTLALARVRKGGLLSLRTDNEDNEPVFFRRKGGYY